MQMINFSKYQGAGNDFILIDNRNNDFDWSEAKIKYLADRKFGIGSDGVMLLESDATCDFYMRFFNPDGSQVGMCGNGSRCIAMFAHDLGIGGSVKTFRTIDGCHKAQIIQHDGSSAQIKIELINIESILKIDQHRVLLNTGVNHHVTFVDNVDSVDIMRDGAEIRYHKDFEHIGGTNANFVEIISDDSIKIRTYERGVENETLACGTGAAASAIAMAYLNGIHNSPISVMAIGGELKIFFEFNVNNVKNIFLQGEAKKVFSGNIDI